MVFLLLVSRLRARAGLRLLQCQKTWSEGHEMRFPAQFNELCEYNTERNRAAGVLYRVSDSPSQRLADRRDAQNWLNSLTPEYVARMEALQREYDEWCRRRYLSDQHFGDVKK